MNQLRLPDMPEGSKHDYWPYITVVSETGHAQRATANEPYRQHTVFRWHTSWGYSELADTADEGVTWVRGWHENDAPAVQAMLSARVMAGPKLMELDEASGAFIRGDISFDQWKNNLDQWDEQFEEQMRAQR